MPPSDLACREIPDLKKTTIPNRKTANASNHCPSKVNGNLNVYSRMSLNNSPLPTRYIPIGIAERSTNALRITPTKQPNHFLNLTADAAKNNRVGAFV